MSIADHFEHAPDAGFIRDYDAGAARRQFNLSMVLIVIVALAAAALGAVVRFDGPATSSGAGQAAAPPSYAGKL